MDEANTTTGFPAEHSGLRRNPYYLSDAPFDIGSCAGFRTPAPGIVARVVQFVVNARRERERRSGGGPGSTVSFGG